MGANILKSTVFVLSLILPVAAFAGSSGGAAGGIMGGSGTAATGTSAANSLSDDPAASGEVGGNPNVEPAKRECNPLARAGTTDSCLF